MNKILHTAGQILEATALKYREIENASVWLTMCHSSESSEVVTTGHLNYAKGAEAWSFELESAKTEVDPDRHNENRCKNLLIVGTDEELWLTVPHDNQIYYADLNELKGAGLLRIPRADTVLLGAIATLLEMSRNCTKCDFKILDGYVRCKATIPIMENGQGNKSELIEVVIDPADLVLMEVNKCSVDKDAIENSNLRWETTVSFSKWLHDEVIIRNRIQKQYRAALRKRPVVLTPEMVSMCSE